MRRAAILLLLLAAPVAAAGGLHDGLECGACHTGRPAAGNAGCTRGGCHAEQAGAFATTPHDAAHLRERAPACWDCHGSHEVVASAAALAETCGGQAEKACAPCHPVERYGARPVGDGTGIHEAARQLRGCAEASISCFACHGAHHVRGPADPASPIHAARVADTCGRCHRTEAEAYRGSVHAEALGIPGIPPPTCVACHGAHEVRAPEDREAPVSRRHVVYTCAECHEDPAVLAATDIAPGVVDSYESSFHGIAYRNGITDVATCASCHGSHDARRPEDPASRVAAGNLRATCGRCHSEVTEELVEAVRHPRGGGGLRGAFGRLRVYFPVAATALNPLLVSGMGALVGFLSGLFGVGGGFLMTPLLIFIGIPAAVAAATDAAQITAGASSGAISHSRLGNVDLKMGLTIVAGGWTGGTVGVQLVRILRNLGNFDFYLKAVYVLILGFIGTVMLVEGVRTLRGSRPSGEPGPSRLTMLFQRLPFQMTFEKSGLRTSVLLPVTAGFVVGVLAAFLGVGGGFIMLPTMIYIIGIPTRVAVGTDLFQIVLTCSWVTVQQAIANHTVDVLLAVTLFVGSTLGAQVGVLASRRLSGEQIRVLLGVIVMVVMVMLLRQLVTEPELLIQFAKSGGGH